MLPAHWCTENYLILRLHRPLQCGCDAELRFKRKMIWNIKREVEAALQQVASEVGALRMDRGIVSTAHGPLEMVRVICSPLNGSLGENGRSLLS